MASPVKHRYARQDDVDGGDDSGTQPTTESSVETTNSSTNSSSSFTSTSNDNRERFFLSICARSTGVSWLISFLGSAAAFF